MDTARKRTSTFDGGLNELELRKLIGEAQLTQEQLNVLDPFFQILIENIHKKWEGLNLDDGAASKALKYQLIVVKNLREAMVKKVNEGKVAEKKLGDRHGNK